ncbi:unannotated protein [freshwater metagenome]|uniref:Unannotated protein n=1 Tax=freshwater metagenome TaxID=449393 RepID=A0A6J7EWK5_9ZZZZ
MAPTTLAYTGDRAFASGTKSLALKAQVAGAAGCLANQTVVFRYDSNGDGSYETTLASPKTDSTGKASYTWTLPTGVVLADVIAVYAATTSCGASSSTAILGVLKSTDTAGGAGWYTGGAARVNFGFQWASSAGTMLWQSSATSRFKGAISSYVKGTCPVQSPSVSGTCATLTGTGTLYTWNAGTNGWDQSATGIAFAARVADASSNKVDSFRMDFPVPTVVGETATLVTIGAGSLTAR